MIRTEARLSDLLAQLLKATQEHEVARKAAVRWFNRIYYDFMRWRDATLAPIRSHKALVGTASKADLEDLSDSLAGPRSRRPQSEFRDNLELLAARFDLGFEWLAGTDPSTHSLLADLLGMAEKLPDANLGGLEGLLASLSEMTRRCIAEDVGSFNRDEALSLIGKHEHEFLIELQGLRSMACDANIRLLEVDEYRSILDQEGSANSKVIVIGGAAGSHGSISVNDLIGPIDIRARIDRVTQSVTSASAIPERKRAELAGLIQGLEEVLGFVGEKQPEDAQRVLQATEMVVAEVSKQRPHKAFLTLSSVALMEAAKVVAGVAPSILDATTKIASFIGKWIV